MPDFQSHMEGEIIHSPSHYAMTGHDFSPEDIQALLGGVLHEPPLASAAASETSPAAAAHAAQASAAQASIPLNHNDAQHDTTTSSSSPDNKRCKTDDQSARVERKRKLEKQRRSDVNKQFSQLQKILRTVESESPEEVRGLPAYAPNNRVELMGRTVALLEKVHESNKKHKGMVQDLQEQLEKSKAAGEATAAKLKEAMMAPQQMGNNKVMMMVPMMIGAGENGASVPMWGGMPGYGMPQMMGMQQAPTNTMNNSNSNNDSSANATTGMQQQQQQMMPCMMQPAQNMMSPWMMQPQPTSNTTDGQKKSANTNGNNSNDSNNGGNLAHCA